MATRFTLVDVLGELTKTAQRGQPILYSYGQSRNVASS